jgi:hypothetical protein
MINGSICMVDAKFCNKSCLELHSPNAAKLSRGFVLRHNAAYFESAPFIFCCRARA